MNDLPSESLERLAYDAAMQMHIALLAEAAQADSAASLEDLGHAAAIHRARAEGMPTTAETLLPQSVFQRCQALMQAVMWEEELQFARDLRWATSQSAGGNCRKNDRF